MSLKIDLSYLPSDAVINYENKNYVFIAKADKHYQMKEIEVGNTENGFTQIISQDISNAPIVVKGAYSILMKMKNVEE